MKHSIILLSIISTLVSAELLANCGSINHGSLPNAPTRYCAGSIVQKYNYCGATAGTLVGSKDHPLMCNTTWTPNPNTVQVCANERIEQCGSYGGTTRCRYVYSRNKGWTWTPSSSTMPIGEAFTQTSNCGFTRQAVGSNCSNSDWSPAASTQPYGITFTQTTTCGGSRQRTGTQESSDWMPATNTVCSGIEFTQTRSYGPSRLSLGSKNCSSGSNNGSSSEVDRRYPGWSWHTTAEGDEGYFQSGGVNVNETILYNDNRNTIIRRYRSAAGHPYRMWIDDNVTHQGFGVNLKDRESFDLWLNYMEEVNTTNPVHPITSLGEQYHPNKHWCELVEDIWSPWTTLAAPTTCGVHTVTQSRTCGVQGAVKPCDFTCPNGTQSDTEQQTTTIDNGACACTEPWGPSTSGTCESGSVDQVRCAGTALEETRTVPGTQVCPTSCTDPWEPAANTICAPIVFAQTRCDGLASSGNRRGSVGTMTGSSCNTGCTDSSWSPTESSFCQNQTFTQTSNCGNSRQATGSMVCGLPAPQCGPLSTQNFTIIEENGFHSTLQAFQAAQVSELCSTGTRGAEPVGDGTGADLLILWQCRQLGHSNKHCNARVTCENPVNPTACTFFIN